MIEMVDCSWQDPNVLETDDYTTARPIKPCPYPLCEQCKNYIERRGEHYCNAPIVVSKQIYRLFEEKIAKLENTVAELEKSLYDEILGADDSKEIWEVKK